MTAEITLQDLATSIQSLANTLQDVVKTVNTLNTKVIEIETTVSTLNIKVGNLDEDVKKLFLENERSNDKLTNYQQASQSLVNLAFSLIASATVITVVSAVFKR
jgi:outer membrane murein-binding lipoprotein Lpp